VTGLDLRQDRDTLLSFCPVQHVAADHPPTLLLHGDADTDVPYEQSVTMARALAVANIPHRLLTIRGGAHGFDVAMGTPVVAKAFDDVLEFLAHHV
jgi:dipeptidyl aminopeptidase/acylaminoacyl peptidase